LENLISVSFAREMPMRIPALVAAALLVAGCGSTDSPAPKGTTIQGTPAAGQTTYELTFNPALK
jgi:outer membrane PBP1 activator LpoA protein